MTEKIKRIITCDVKADGDDRVLTFDGSTETLDRADEVISAAGWELENYENNPVFLWAHNYSMPPIGKATKTWVQGKRLKFKIEFADTETYPFADTIYRLYKGGFMRAVSVGFLPLEVEDAEDDSGKSRKGKQPRRRYVRQELLELSAVPVPCNPDALQNAVRAGALTAKDVGLLERQFKSADGQCAPDDTLCFIDQLNAATQRMAAGAKALAGGMTAKDEPILYEDDATIYRLVVVPEDKAKYTCECLDCGYKLQTDKHCPDVKCPKCGGGMRRVERPGPGRSLADEYGDDISRAVDGAVAKRVISYASAHPDGTPKAPEDAEWDAAKEVKAAAVDDLKVMCAFVDGDSEKKTSYKLPHHRADHKLVWRGVAAAASVLMGGRGGIDASDTDIAGMKNHIAKHYREFDKTPPWESRTETVQGLWGTYQREIISQAELLDEMEYLITRLDEAGISEYATDMAHELTRTIMRLTGGDMPEDIRAALSAPAKAGGDLVAEAQPIIRQAVHDAMRDVLQPLKNIKGEDNA